MSLSSLIWGQSQFDEAVDKATSELRLAEEDIALNLEICDQLRSKSVPAKDAARALKRRLNHKNPNVQLLALGLTDICVKNGGDNFLSEVASKEFMDNLVSILKIPHLNIDVRNKILRLIQNWSIAFEGKYNLGYVNHAYKELKSEGFNFPPKDLTVANSVMVDTSTAPDWIDSDVCLRCRTAFTFTNRKHHCRNCGQVFDQQCSSKSMSLPHFGIGQEVRVCDSCYAKLNKVSRDRERSHSADFYSGHRAPSSSRVHKHRSARDLADADLQRAIQLSLAESGQTSSHGTQSYEPSYNQWHSSEPPLVDRGSRLGVHKPGNSEEDDPELKAAIEASLREANGPKPSAPIATSYDESEGYSYGAPTSVGGRNMSSVQPPLPSIPNHDLHPRESDAILMFNQTVQDAHAQGTSDLSRIPDVNELYDRANGMRPKLALSLDDAGRKEEMLSEMHNKLSQAVKLYDQLLTEQLSRPTWRTTSTSQQSYDRTPSRYHTVDESHKQYASSPPPIPVQNRPPIQGPTIQEQPSYAPDYGTASMYSQPQYSSNPQQQPSATAVPNVYQEQRPEQYSSGPQPAHSGVPVSQLQHQYLTPASEHWANTQPHQVPASQQTNQPVLSQPHSQYIPTSPAPSHQQHTPSPYIPAVSPQAPVNQQQYAHILAQPPAPTQQHKLHYQPTPSSTLSRHNTVSHTPYVPPSSTLGRSNTIASYPQPQQAYASTSATLPAFPTAPTSNPQMLPMYSPPVTGFEHTEKKEAPLIEL